MAEPIYISFQDVHKFPIDDHVPGVPPTVHTHPFGCPLAGAELPQKSPARYDPRPGDAGRNVTQFLRVRVPVSTIVPV